jgi:growth factor-regulated tyrosine kinase substrate
MRAINRESHSHDVPKVSHSPPNARGSRSKTFRDADTDLQRAIQLSLEAAGVSGALGSSGYTPSQPPSTVNPNNGPADLDFGNDPDLKAAIEASLRDVPNPIPSAPLPVEFPQPVALPPRQISPSQPLPTSFSTLPNYDMDLRESDTIMTFSQTVEQAQHDPNGRDISRYPALNQLYDQANGLRPKLAMSLDDTSRRESEVLCVPDIILDY